MRRRHLNLQDFSRRVAKNDFEYNSFYNDGTGKVCWLSALVGVERAHKLYPSAPSSTEQERFLARVPDWADYSAEDDRRENAELLQAILERRHSEDEYRQLNECLGELGLELRKTREFQRYNTPYTIAHLEIALLWGAAAASAELVTRRKKRAN